MPAGGPAGGRGGPGGPSGHGQGSSGGNRGGVTGFRGVSAAETAKAAAIASGARGGFNATPDIDPNLDPNLNKDLSVFATQKATTSAELSAALAKMALAKVDNQTINEAVKNSTLGFKDKQDAINDFYKTMPKSLKLALTAVSPIPTGIVTNIAAALAAVTGQVMSSPDTDPNAGGGLTDSQYDKMAGLGFTRGQIDKYRSSGEGGQVGTRGDGVGGTTEGGGQAAATTRLWDEFKNEWFSDENNAKDLYQGQADYLAGEALRRNEALGSATGEQTENIDDLVRAYAKPVSFNIMGDDVSFVPRGSRNTISGLTDIGQTKMGNIQNLANDVFQTAPLTAPGVGKLSYIDALSKILGGEASREADAARAAAASRELDQREPGWSDYIGEAVDIGSGLIDIGKGIASFF